MGLHRIISYSLLACFCQVNPWMTIVGALYVPVEYKLLAFFAANFGNRPLPLPSYGIGAWEDIINLVSSIAISINVAMAVFVTTPLRMYGFFSKLLAFVVVEKVLLVLRFCLSRIVGRMPDDVHRMQDDISMV